MQIDKNIPIPVATSSRKRAIHLETISKMEIGDSVVIKRNQRSSFYYAAIILKKEITSRVEGDGQYIRIWLVK